VTAARRVSAIVAVLAPLALLAITVVVLVIVGLKVLVPWSRTRVKVGLDASVTECFYPLTQRPRISN